MSLEWLFMCLVACGCPTGLYNAISSMYVDNIAFVNIDGMAFHIYDILSGVHQGCPLSGWLFVFGMNPLVNAFDKLIDSSGKGITRVCADDVGTSLSAVEQLESLY